jgi:ABC-type sugar transport system substrate-binding protein
MMEKSKFSAALSILFAVALLAPNMAHAAETKTYTYDALGRLVVVKSTGNANNNQVRSYCYDKAGNRVEFAADQVGTPANCVKTH